MLAQIAGNFSKEQKNFLPRGFHRVEREASKWTGNQTTRVLARGSIFWFPLAAQLQARQLGRSTQEFGISSTGFDAISDVNRVPPLSLCLEVR